VIAGPLLLAAGVADRSWAHVVGLALGVAASAALLAVSHRPRTRRVDPHSLLAGLPVLLPAGAALGWLGPAYAGEGLAAAVAVLLATMGAGALRPSRTSERDRNRNRSVLGLALTAGVAVATVTAVALGAGVGA